MKIKTPIQAMRYIILIAMLFVGSVNAQPGSMEDVRLRNDSLFRINKNTEWVFKGKVTGGVLPPFTGIFKDANGNVDISDRGGTIFTGNNYGNFIFGNNTDMRGANNVAALAPDCIVYPGANYAMFSGDAHHIGGYASTTTGYFNKNFMEAGTAIGTNIVLGTLPLSNQLYRSVGIGTQMNINNTDVFMFGYGNGVNTEFNTKGTWLSYGTHKLGLLPDGRIMINGIAYRFPTTQGAGVLTNDGNGNLSWSNSAISKSISTAETQKPLPSGKYMVYDMMGRLYTIVRVQ